MRTLMLFVMLLVCLFVGAGGAFAQGTGCVGMTGMRDDGIYYTDCFPLWSGIDSSDDDRLQRAVYTATGKLVFNEIVYYVDGPIKLKSSLIIEGVSNRSNTPSPTPPTTPPATPTPTPAGTPYPAPTMYISPRIVAIADNFNVFEFDPGINQVTIRDIGFSYYNPKNPNLAGTNNAAISAYGANSNDPSGFENNFSNLNIYNFYWGIKVDTGGTNGWMFDQIHLSDTTIDACHIGVYLNSSNSGWQMDNVDFSTPVGGYGIYIERSGYVSMNLVVGNGNTVNGQPGSETFIYVKRHSSMNITGSSYEAYKKALHIDGVQDNKQSPITLQGNGFPACPSDGVPSAIIINNATVASIGNNYTCSPLIALRRYSAGPTYRPPTTDSVTMTTPGVLTRCLD